LIMGYLEGTPDEKKLDRFPRNKDLAASGGSTGSSGMGVLPIAVAVLAMGVSYFMFMQ